MQLYEIAFYLKYDEKKEGKLYGRRAQKEGSHAISNECEKFSAELEDNGCFFLSNSCDSMLEFGLIVREAIDVDGYVKRFADKIALDIEDIDIEEITLADFRRTLTEANRHDYVYDVDEILEEYELDMLVGGSRHEWLPFNEKVILENSKKAIYSSVDRYFTKRSLVEELNRIFIDGEQKAFVGHPVDYMIECDDTDTLSNTKRLLIQALYRAGRLENKRYSELDISKGQRYGKRTINSLYKAGKGGTVVVSGEIEDCDDDDQARGDFDALEKVCETARKYRKDVLTIFCLPRCCENIKRKIFENMNGCTFVEIRDELAYYDQATEYLKLKAREHKIRCDKNLFASLEEGTGYLTPELNKIFDEWYGKKLKNSVFSQYKDFECVDVTVAKEKPKGKAYDELNEMIGLESAKKVINQALDSYKALKLFKDKGIVADETSNHMIFTGNPGTAKTTVARLFARIMKENDIISKGQIVEVGRGDLVGKYVGWTAPTIQKKFKDAVGGVLFIDEAYSLVDDRDGLYGDEAINTIVQEMENHRGEVIVIFAGYPDKMEGFLKKNPGLRSRIAHHVHFEDYNPDELCEIAKLIAKQKGVKLDDDAMIKVRKIMEQAVVEEDFGNGRFVRNVIEKAKMAQCSRLVHMDVEAVTPEKIKLICAEDIEIPEVRTREIRRIGFIA